MKSHWDTRMQLQMSNQAITYMKSKIRSHILNSHPHFLSQCLQALISSSYLVIYIHHSFHNATFALFFLEIRSLYSYSKSHLCYLLTNLINHIISEFSSIFGEKMALCLFHCQEEWKHHNVSIQRNLQ